MFCVKICSGFSYKSLLKTIFFHFFNSSIVLKREQYKNEFRYYAFSPQIRFRRSKTFGSSGFSYSATTQRQLLRCLILQIWKEFIDFF